MEHQHHQHGASAASSAWSISSISIEHPSGLVLPDMSGWSFDGIFWE
jgi:hypothetical protein